MNDFLKNHLNILKKNFSNPELELRVLLKQTLIKQKEIIFSNFDINDINLNFFDNSFRRRINKEPLSKIFNNKNFWKYNFFVNSDVLDPRPESELIIENILKFYSKKDSQLKILDMCTGSGCLAISLSKEFFRAKVTATDISTKAIEVAKINAFNLNCFNQINFVECDLLNTTETYDIVVCNPPYLSETEYKKTSPEIQLYEPKIALVAESNGYEFYKRISNILPKIMTQKSRAFLEIGSLQAKININIFKSNKINCLEVVKDIQNLDRLLILNKS
jgi:release factor glutamine methyltransferase